MKSTPVVSAIVVAACLVVLAGCGGGAKGPSSAARPKHPLPEEPLVVDTAPGQYGGRLVLSMLGSPKSFNAMITNDSPTNDVISGAVWEGLLDFDNVTQEVIPGLLASWSPSADGLVWTLKLRKGLRWSDGHPLTVDDVLFTTDVLQDTALHINAASLLVRSGSFPPFARVDDQTFTVTLKKPFGPFLHAISGFRVIPKHKLEGAWKAGRFAQTWGLDTPPDSLVGSGPFMITRYVPNESVTLKPNPWFYRVDSKQQRLPYLDEVIWLIVPDQNAELIKFKSGETDGLYARSEDVEGLKAEAEAGHFTVTDLGPEYGSNFVFFNMNTAKDEKGKPFVDPAKQSWFHDKEFRKAVAHAIDRESIIRNVYLGQAAPQYGILPDVNKVWHNPGITKYPYDLEKARSILAAAGYKDGDGDGIVEDPKGRKVSFRLTTNTNNKERVASSALVAEDLRKIGLDVQFQPLEFATVIQSIQKTRDYDMAMLGLSGGNPPDPVMAAGTMKSSGGTHFWWTDQKKPATAWEAEIDSLFDAQLGLSTDAERKPYVDRIQAIIADEIPVVYTVSKKGFVAIRNKVRNTRPSIFRPYIAWNVDELWIDPKAGTDSASK